MRLGFVQSLKGLVDIKWALRDMCELSEIGCFSERQTVFAAQALLLQRPAPGTDRGTDRHGHAGSVTQDCRHIPDVASQVWLAVRGAAPRVVFQVPGQTSMLIADSRLPCGSPGCLLSARSVAVLLPAHPAGFF